MCSRTPTSSTTEGEWLYEEGCLSLPGLAFDIVRPKVVTVTGLDLEGNEVTVVGDELLGRLLLHEVDHLDGVLMLERLEADDRKLALRALREQSMNGSPTANSAGTRSERFHSRGRGSADPMRLVFLGSPDDAVPPLRALVAAGHEVALVVTRPDRRRGRGAARPPSPVKRAATELGLPVVTPERSNDAIADARRKRRDPRRRRRVRPDPAARVPRSVARRLRQPALLAAAALARRGAGRAGDPRR